MNVYHDGPVAYSSDSVSTASSTEDLSTTSSTEMLSTASSDGDWDTYEDGLTDQEEGSYSDSSSSDEYTLGPFTSRLACDDVESAGLSSTDTESPDLTTDEDVVVSTEDTSLVLGDDGQVHSTSSVTASEALVSDVDAVLRNRHNSSRHNCSTHMRKEPQSSTSNTDTSTGFSGALLFVGAAFCATRVTSLVRRHGISASLKYVWSGFASVSPYVLGFLAVFDLAAMAYNAHSSRAPVAARSRESRRGRSHYD